MNGARDVRLVPGCPRTAAADRTIREGSGGTRRLGTAIYRQEHCPSGQCTAVGQVTTVEGLFER